MKIAVLLITMLFLQDPAKPAMSWNLTKDQKLRYEFNHKIIKGVRDRTEEMALTLVVTLTPGPAGKGGEMPATMTFDRISYSRVRHGESEAYDSARDKEPSGSSYTKVLSKCVGKSIPIKLSQSGKFTAEEELKKLVQAAVDAFPEVKAKAKWNAEGVAETAGRLETLFRIGFQSPKGGPAAVGEKWETKIEDKSVTPDVGFAVSTARLKEIREGVAVVDQAIRFEFSREAAGFVKESSGQGSFTWDLAGGRLKTLGTTAKIVTLGEDIAYSLTVALLPEAK